jgi:hypothetical protein
MSGRERPFTSRFRCNKGMHHDSTTRIGAPFPRGACETLPSQISHHTGLGAGGNDPTAAFAVAKLPYLRTVASFTDSLPRRLGWIPRWCFWKLNSRNGNSRLAYDDGEWHCSLSKDRALPDCWTIRLRKRDDTAACNNQRARRDTTSTERCPHTAWWARETSTRAIGGPSAGLLLRRSRRCASWIINRGTQAAQISSSLPRCNRLAV